MKHSYYSHFDQEIFKANFPYFKDQVFPMNDCPELDTQEHLVESEEKKQSEYNKNTSSTLSLYF